MPRRFEPWIAVACLVIFASPLLQGLASGSGINVATVMVAFVMGGFVLAVYVRMLGRARRDLDS